MDVLKRLKDIWDRETFPLRGAEKISSHNYKTGRERQGVVYCSVGFGHHGGGVVVTGPLKEIVWAEAREVERGRFKVNEYSDFLPDHLFGKAAPSSFQAEKLKTHSGPYIDTFSRDEAIQRLHEIQAALVDAGGRLYEVQPDPDRLLPPPAVKSANRNAAPRP